MPKLSTAEFELQFEALIIQFTNTIFEKHFESILQVAQEFERKAFQLPWEEIDSILDVEGGR